MTYSTPLKILIGAPLCGKEALFLRRLDADLKSTEALILANFHIKGQQVDFFVVTPKYSALIELKNFSRPIFGGRNGMWEYQNTAGHRVLHEATNPWEQALKQRFAISDQMHRYQKKYTGVPSASESHFYLEFATFVCIFPEISPQSNVTASDNKVQVKSYGEILKAIRDGGKSSAWKVHDWELFAERELKLDRVTLEEATDSKELAARNILTAYRERIKTVLGAELPPLIADEGYSNYGPRLITRLQEPQNYLLIGPTGAAKTFHLHHLAVELASSTTEIPVMVAAKNFRGNDFWSLLKQSVAPFHRGNPNDLFKAARINGQSPVLLLDALNECADMRLSDLLRGAQAFILHFDARAVLTSQQFIELSGDLKATSIAISLPNATVKRTIYAHHAGLQATPDLDKFCAGFTNAYDLTVAGRCHTSGMTPRTRVDLYDRYVRRCLPQRTALMSGLLRYLAGVMSDEVSFVLSRGAFEDAAEKFLAEQDASLDILDTVSESRLVELTSEAFSFEHEILLQYFRAEHLRRCVPNLATLIKEIKRPRNQDLIEYLISKIRNESDIKLILKSIVDPMLLSRVCAGVCGMPAQRMLLEECEGLLAEAVTDLSRIEVVCVTVLTDGGRRLLTGIEVKGEKEWTAWHRLLCQVIAENLGLLNLQQPFFALVDATEQLLKSAVYGVAQKAGFTPSSVWGEAVRLYGGLLEHGCLKLPCTAMLSDIRNFLMSSHSRRQSLPFRDQFLERVDHDSEGHFSLLILLEDYESGADAERIPENLMLIEKAWASGIYILRNGALEFVEQMSAMVHDRRPELVSPIRTMLERFESDNILLNTTLMQALASFGGLELELRPADAANEMRSFTRANIFEDPQVVQIARLGNVAPAEWIAASAYACLSKIFEDVFQGIYYQAYQSLNDSEKFNILYLAAQDLEGEFIVDWILQELLLIGDKRALPIFEQFASEVKSSTSFVQGSVAAYALGIRGCALWSKFPPQYKGSGSSAHRAWQTIGKILFWHYRAESRGDSQDLAQLWTYLDDEALLASGDVLFWLANVQGRLAYNGPGSANFSSLWPTQVRRIAELCVSYAKPLPSLFSGMNAWKGGTTRFLIELLGQIGGESSLPALQKHVEDIDYGKDAIQAIASIQRRILGL